MRNPYDVLGIGVGANDEQVKAAYREKAKRYVDNPEKMREIDEAYDAIVMNRTGNGYTASDNTQYTYSQGTVSLGEVRAKINAGRVAEADSLLESMPITLRNAEWYYLKGTVQHRHGWLEEATANFNRACQMEPNNGEYRRAAETVNKSRSAGYRTEQPKSSSSSGCCHCDADDICSGLLCADCCCESLGGDLIPCC
ncbi:MAG TPA: molecular chaperone DnaJ [Ruminococcaceae bacterium]|nr:molecular chaperone DnaJ [Oscillospiraceae bacterium]